MFVFRIWKASLALVACATVLLQPVVTAQAPGNGKLRAGSAKIDITPKQSDLALPTDVLRDPLFARAIVVDDGKSCAVLVGLDLSGVNDQAVMNAIARASASTKCPAENFVVSSTHTHSSSTQGLEVGYPSPKQMEDIIVSVVESARTKLAPAKVGYGTARVDLNVNRDLFNNKQEWRQAANPEGPSDKTLAVVEFVGADYVPIGVYMNYAMHPINFYLTGVVSADFPGEASRYIEDLFDNRTVAIFTQGAAGDQNPALPAHALGRIRNGRGPFVETVGAPEAPRPAGPATGFNAAAAANSRKPVPPENMDAYKRAIELTGKNVSMMGTLLGANAVQLMRERIQPTDTARIWGAREAINCPGRIRLDADNPTRENVFPGYKDGPDVEIRVGLLKIGDINLVTVNGEVYSQIGMRLKAASPATKTILVTLANGRANSGYIYSDDSYSHLTFQVIGSRLKPGCAEGGIIAKALELMHRGD